MPEYVPSASYIPLNNQTILGTSGVQARLLILKTQTIPPPTPNLAFIFALSNTFENLPPASVYRATGHFLPVPAALQMLFKAGRFFLNLSSCCPTKEIVCDVILHQPVALATFLSRSHGIIQGKEQQVEQAGWLAGRAKNGDRLLYVPVISVAAPM